MQQHDDMIATFLGIDLAWQSERNPTGAVALRESAGRLQLLEAAPPLPSLAAVYAFIERNESRRTFVAVDGPLVIPNSTGQRRCELELSRQFGSRHASCHSSNSTLYPDAGSVRLANWLASRGFEHAGSASGDRLMLEVYPHAAYVALFELPSIIRYKKGSAAEKVLGLRTVQHTLRELPWVYDAALDELLSVDPSTMRGRARKSFEDSLDALFCAYLAFHFSRYGMSACQIFGNSADGYIINPTTALARLAVAAA